MATISTCVTKAKPMHPVQDPLSDKSAAAQMHKIASFYSVVAWLFFTLLTAVIVFVPSLALKATEAGSIIVGVMIGAITVGPITVLVLCAAPSAKTPWLWCEVTAILICVASTSMSSYIVRAPIIFGSASYENYRCPLTLISISTTAALTIPLVIALQKATTHEDRRRVKLCLVTALWPLLLIPGFLDLVPPLVGFIFQDLVFGCVLFLGASLFLDRKIQAIEHSTPYAACYGWGLSTSMIGFQILLNRKFHSVLVLNVVLSVYSTFLLWCFSQMASRVTTKQDESSLMLPGSFAVEMFQVVLYATAGVQLWSWDFMGILVFQEVASVALNGSIACTLWYRHMRCVDGRKNALNQAWGSQLAKKIVVHSIAELMGILIVYAIAAVETLHMYLGAGKVMCAVAHCRAQMVDFQLLGLYGVVLIVRLLVMVGELALLLRVLEDFHQIGVSRVHPLQAASLTIVVDGGLKSEHDVDERKHDVDERKHSAATSTSSVASRACEWLNSEVRKLLGEANSVATHALTVAVFMQVVSFASMIRNDF